jgi:hypothetical protein
MRPRPRTFRRLYAIVSALALAAVAGAQDASPHPLAIRVKRALTISGDPIEDAVIVIENGRITAIGAQASTDVPEEADVIDGDGLWATPGFIHPAALAMGPSAALELGGRNNSADRLAADDLAPTWAGVKTLAKTGYTRANVIVASGGFAGQSVLIKPLKKLDRPIRPADVLVTRELGLCMGFEAHTTTKTLWRETLAKVKKHREDRASAARPRSESAPASRPESAESKPADAPATRASEPAQDPKLTPIVDVFDGKMPGILALSSAAAVLHLFPILQEHPDFKPAVMIGDEAWRVVDQVKKLGVPVIMQPNRVNRPDTSVEIVPVRDYVDAGVAVALVPEVSFAQQYEGFPFHLAELVRKGVSRDAVLRGVTLTPAEILGIQKEVGSLEKGKAADVLLWSGDPLAPGSELVRVIVGGNTVLDAKEAP